MSKVSVKDTKSSKKDDKVTKDEVKETKSKVTKEEVKDTKAKVTVTKEEVKETKSVKKDDVKVAKEDTKDETKEARPKSADPKTNENTKKAGLCFDVNTRKKWFKSYLNRFQIPVFEKVEGTDGKATKRPELDDEGKQKTVCLNVSGAQYALASVEQVLCSTVVSLAFPKAVKSKSGLYEMNSALLKDAVLNDTELLTVFGQYLKTYDASSDYFSQLKISKEDEIRNYVEKYCLDNATVQLTTDGFNFLLFVLQRNRILLTNCAYRFTKYAKKKTINENTIIEAVEYQYEQAPLLCERMIKKFSAVATLVEEAQKVEKQLKEKKTAEKAKTAKADEKKGVKKEEVKKTKKKDDSDSDSDVSESDSDDE